MPRREPDFHEKHHFDDGATLELTILCRAQSCSGQRAWAQILVLRQGWKASHSLLEQRKPKGDHRHYGSREMPYKFSTVERLISDFLADVATIRKEGNLDEGKIGSSRRRRSRRHRSSLYRRLASSREWQKGSRATFVFRKPRRPLVAPDSQEMGASQIRSPSSGPEHSSPFRTTQARLPPGPRRCRCFGDGGPAGAEWPSRASRL